MQLLDLHEEGHLHLPVAVEDFELLQGSLEALVKIAPLRIITLKQLQFSRGARQTLTYALRNREQIRRRHSNDAATHGAQYHL
jgi:hypothetical protein